MTSYLTEINSGNHVNQLTETGRQCFGLAKAWLCVYKNVSVQHEVKRVISAPLANPCLCQHLKQMVSQMKWHASPLRMRVESRENGCVGFFTEGCIKAEWVKIFGQSQPDISSSMAEMLCDTNGNIVFIWDQIHGALIQTTVETLLLCQQLWTGLILFTIHDLFH